MSDWKEKLASVGKKMFGSGAAGNAADTLKDRHNRLKQLEEEAEGTAPPAKSGADKGEIGKKWDDTFQK